MTKTKSKQTQPNAKGASATLEKLHCDTILALNSKICFKKNRDVKELLVRMDSDMYAYMEEFITYLNTIIKFEGGKKMTINRFLLLCVLEQTGIDVRSDGTIDRGFLQKNMKAMMEERILNVLDVDLAKNKKRK